MPRELQRKYIDAIAFALEGDPSEYDSDTQVIADRASSVARSGQLRPLTARCARLGQELGRVPAGLRLHRLITAAAAGTGGVVVIVGEPGAGKTRLVEAAAAAAADAGLAVRLGHAADQEVERTLGVALGAFNMRLDQLVGAGAATRIVLAAGATAAAEFLLADRLLEVVEAQCALGPLLLAVEDLHWSDPATLAWLRAVGERAAALPLAVVVTTRPAPVGSPVRRTLDALAAPRIELTPLGPDDVRVLATTVLGQPPDPALDAALGAAAGNPLLVLAVLDHHGGGDAPAGHGVLAIRLAELHAPELRTLQTAAVLGPRVDPVELATVTDDRLADLLAHLDAAVAAGLLVPQAERFAFRHELYREAVLATVAAPARRLLHLQVARALARAGAPTADVAEHFARGARPGDREAVRWLRGGAAEIITVAPASALRLVDVALALTGTTPPDELALTALIQGRPADCVAEIERCAELTAGPAARARAHGELAFARFMAIDHAGARAAANQAVRDGGRHGDLAAQVGGDAVLCYLGRQPEYARNLPRSCVRSAAREDRHGHGRA